MKLGKAQEEKVREIVKETIGTFLTDQETIIIELQNKVKKLEAEIKKTKPSARTTKANVKSK